MNMDDIEKRLGTDTTNGLITVAYASTNDISIPPGGITTGKMGFRYSDKIKVINPQLRIWLEAKRQYAEYISVNENPRIEDFVLVISSLYTSITVLFGTNLMLENAPEFTAVLNRFGLKKSRSNLHRELKNLHDTFSKILRHPTREKLEQELKDLTKGKVRNFMITVAETWKWFCSRNRELTEEEKILFDYSQL